MHAIGIDMSKDSFHAAFSDTHVCEFKNTEDGIASFTEAMRSLGLQKEETVIGVESTGVYHLLLCVRLFEHGWHIHVINPTLTAQMISAGLRMVKNDRKDARIIRMATALGKGHPFRDTPDILALKALVSEREDIVRMRAELKQRQRAHEIRAHACGVALHDSYAPVFAALDAAVEDVNERLRGHATGTQQLLQSVTGVGATTAAFLVAYVGDISRFGSAEQLVAYVGIDPRVKQSGTSIRGRGYITKRGSQHLRTALYRAAFIAQRHDPELHTYYKKKRAEGMHHVAVLCAIERKLVHRIFAVWKRGTPYVKTPKA